MDLRTDDFDYQLPAELIAQEPAARRDSSRLMILDRVSQSIRHDRFGSIGRYLRPGDVLVANRSRVIPARLQAAKESGGAVELLLVRRAAPGCWEVLARPSRKLKPGMYLAIKNTDVSARLESQIGEGQWRAHFAGGRGDDVDAELYRAGSLPLPPYIHNSSAPPERYQTIYGDRDGSIAAPTAGLHFSEDLLAKLRGQGIEVRFVTLHVGIGTFRPVTVDRVNEHRMHAEWGEITPEVADAVNRGRQRGRRIIAVGTTTTRLLESAVRGGEIQPFRGDTDRFIYPGYQFQAIDGLVTNFHLPRSTLLMLVSALAGREFILSAYQSAVEHRYRFFSFGDAMLIV